MTLQDRVYIVTGGSQGFGLAIANSLIARGAKVGLIARNQVALDEAVAALGAEHALGVAADVGSVGQVAAAFGQIKAHFGRLDGLVNNAGMARPGKVELLVEAQVQQQVQTNFLGTVFCCQAAIPLLRDSANPGIVNISSATVVHFDEASHMSIYAATKSAVERFTRDLREELQVDGIAVTCVRPGAAMTGFADGWDAEAMASCFEAWVQAGAIMDTGMSVEHVGEAVAYALEQPPGVAVDMLEIRPNIATPKAGV